LLHSWVDTGDGRLAVHLRFHVATPLLTVTLCLCLVASEHHKQIAVEDACQSNTKKVQQKGHVALSFKVERQPTSRFYELYEKVCRVDVLRHA
jgi:hypothetical protein